MGNLILVDVKDNNIGSQLKEKCHKGEGILHRAFSIFIFNENRQLLIQKRSKHKKLWPLYWSNTCCSHPKPGENLKQAAERRLKEEMGILCDLDYLYKFRYKAKYLNIGSENEICGVFVGKSNSKVLADPMEILNHKWVNLNFLEKDMKINSDKYTPWFKIEFQELFSNYITHIEELFFD